MNILEILKDYEFGLKVASQTKALELIAIEPVEDNTDIGKVEVNYNIDFLDLSNENINSVLQAKFINEISQVLSKDIIDRIFEMGDSNRKTVPGYTNETDPTTIFDLNADTDSSENSTEIFVKLKRKIKYASMYVATQGMIGEATYIITNSILATALVEKEIVLSHDEHKGNIYAVGEIDGITIFVNPYMLFTDNRIVLGRLNNADQPGLVLKFIPELFALIDKTSRYSLVENTGVENQYLTILVKDTQFVLA